MNAPDRRIVFSDGYGGRLLGVDPGLVTMDEEVAIRVARREVALLRPDLYVLDPNADALVAACVEAVSAGTAVWQVADGLMDHPRLVALRAVATALDFVDTALTLPTPTALARAITESRAFDMDWNDLVEEAEYALIDCVTVMTSGRGCSAVILRDDSQSSIPDDVWPSLVGLRKVLEHRTIPCYLRLDGIDDGTQAGEWLRARAHAGWPEALVIGPHHEPATDPRLIELVSATDFDQRKGVVAIEVHSDTRPEDIHAALNGVR